MSQQHAPHCGVTESKKRFVWFSCCKPCTNNNAAAWKHSTGWAALQKSWAAKVCCPWHDSVRLQNAHCITYKQCYCNANCSCVLIYWSVPVTLAPIFSFFLLEGNYQQSQLYVPNHCSKPNKLCTNFCFQTCYHNQTMRSVNIWLTFNRRKWSVSRGNAKFKHTVIFAVYRKSVTLRHVQFLLAFVQ